MSRRQQFTQAYQMTKRSDPRIGLILFAWFLLGAAIGAGLFWLLPPQSANWLKIVIVSLGALLFGLMAALIVFSRRAERAVYSQMDGQLGAGAAALQMLRKGWKTQPTVAFTKQQDVVHRVVGPPGLVLVGEGNPNRLRPLMTSERRKLERVVAETPVHEIIVGDNEGQVALSKLVKSVQKLPKAVKPAEMTDILSRLKAFDASRPSIPLPKGPVPTSMKGLRQNMRGR